jgi:hypothetical protein
MGTPWSALRHKQYRSRHPYVERAEQRRQAQVRYRKRHAKWLAHARCVTNILVRQTWHADDFKQLAASLRALMTKEGIRALHRELGRDLSANPQKYRGSKGSHRQSAVPGKP